MFDRNCSLLEPHHHTAQVPIIPESTCEAEFAHWLESLPPLFCRRHKRTRLVLDREATGRAPDSERIANRWNCWWMQRDVPDPATRAKLYPFEAVFRCPACRCAYALCPPEFHETSFETFNTSTPERSAALARCREFVAQVNQRGRGFALLVGLTGTGKTRLACNIVRELQNPDALYVRQGELTIALRATYSKLQSIRYECRLGPLCVPERRFPPRPWGRFAARCWRRPALRRFNGCNACGCARAKTSPRKSSPGRWA